MPEFFLLYNVPKPFFFYFQVVSISNQRQRSRKKEKVATVDQQTGQEGEIMVSIKGSQSLFTTF